MSPSGDPSPFAKADQDDSDSISVCLEQEVAVHTDKVSRLA